MQARCFSRIPIDPAVNGSRLTRSTAQGKLSLMALSRDEALALLSSPQSAQRRRGAKRLRTLGDPSTAAAVRVALQRELQDERTWETQYQLVMALGAAGDSSDVVWLKDLAGEPRDATMINCALGDAIVRLGHSQSTADEPVMWCQRQSIDLLDEGAQRATALLKLVPRDPTVNELISKAESRLWDPEHPHDLLGLWVVIAAAGWRGERVDVFLDRCLYDRRDEVAKAASEAQQGRYMKMSYL